MGPETGLRQVAISRYSLGFYPSSIIAALNVIEQLGWASVNCITGGLALNAVSDGRVSIVVGVVIVACVSFLFSFVGLKGVLMYEQYAWVVFFVIFMIIYGESAHRMDLAAPPTVSDMTRSGNVLSLIGVVYGSSASWSSIVSDFYVHYPVNISKVKVFLYTTLGITIPTCVGMLLGACISSALDTNPEWAAAYDNGIGEILQTIMYPRGFAKFLLVLLVLSGSTSAPFSAQYPIIKQCILTTRPSSRCQLHRYLLRRTFSPALRETIREGSQGSLVHPCLWRHPCAWYCWSRPLTGCTGKLPLPVGLLEYLILRYLV
jgi:purine-cytosine permease-like protein